MSAGISIDLGTQLIISERWCRVVAGGLNLVQQFCAHRRIVALAAQVEQTTSTSCVGWSARRGTALGGVRALVHGGGHCQAWSADTIDLAEPPTMPAGAASTAPHPAASIVGTLRVSGMPSLRSSSVRCSTVMNVVKLHRTPKSLLRRIISRLARFSRRSLTLVRRTPLTSSRLWIVRRAHMVAMTPSSGVGGGTGIDQRARAERGVALQCY